MTSTLKESDRLAASVAQTANRITLADLQAKITDAAYYRPDFAPHVTIAVLQTVNGFTLVGKSAPADPANFDPDAGRTFAYDDALRQLWALEGYALRERMAATKPAPDA